MLITALGGLLSAGLVAVSLVVIHDRHADSARRQAHERLLHQQSSYLRHVRSLAAQVRHDVRAVQEVLDALSRPRAGDIYAARDALANDEAAVALSHDLAVLQKLSVPARWQRHADHLHKSLKDIRDAVVSMRDLRKERDWRKLNLFLQTSAGTALSDAEIIWGQGLQSLFAERKQDPPVAPAPFAKGAGPPSIIGWAFGADRSCVRGEIRGFPALSRLNRNHGDTLAIRQVGVIITKTAHELQSLKLPDGAVDVRHSVVDHLRSLATEGRILVAEANAIDRGDLNSARRAVDRLRTTTAALPVLASGFRKLHLVACFNFVGPGKHGGHKPGIAT
jgi:hypothetical protein